jgi:hypothetical protein
MEFSTKNKTAEIVQKVFFGEPPIFTDELEKLSSERNFSGHFKG